MASKVPAINTPQLDESRNKNARVTASASGRAAHPGVGNLRKNSSITNSSNGLLQRPVTAKGKTSVPNCPLPETRPKSSKAVNSAPRHKKPQGTSEADVNDKINEIESNQQVRFNPDNLERLVEGEHLKEEAISIENGEVYGEVFETFSSNKCYNVTLEYDQDGTLPVPFNNGSSSESSAVAELAGSMHPFNKPQISSFEKVTSNGHAVEDEIPFVSNNRPGPQRPVGPEPFCNANCNGLHFCLQNIPVPEGGGLQWNSRRPSHVDDGSVTDTDRQNNAKVAENPKSNLHKAFKDLHHIRNLAFNSGLCELEDYNNFARIEQLMLKVFSKTESVAHCD